MLRILFFLFLTTSILWAQEVYKKTISFDWDPVPGAVKYEVRFINYKNGTPIATSQFTTTNSYYGSIPPGYYKMSLRSLDKRDVPGVWSAEVEFPVLLDKVKVSSPSKENYTLKSMNEDYQEIEFAWSPVLGADKYHLLVKDNETDKVLFENYFAELNTKVNLPVGAKYTWSIQAFDNADLKSDSETLGELTIIGNKLKKPIIDTPETQFVREIKWKEDPYAQSYQVELQKFNPSLKKWEKKVEEKTFKGNKIAFDDKWPGGNYRIVLQAKGNLRPDSDRSQMNFNVKTGDRSIAAEYSYVLRKSIDRINGLYTNASWLLSMINYSSSYKGLNPKYNVFGGTARLGLGWFKENNPIGYYGNWDISGFLKDESYMRSFVYHSLSGSVIYRKSMRTTDEFRISSGLFYKEIPQTIADLDEIANYFVANNRSIYGFKGTSNQVISMAGPHLGVEYWFSLTPKLGFQVNAQWYYSMMAVKLPNNGKNFKPSLSDQYGIMGSYKVNNKFTGLLGLAYKKEQAAYKDESTSGGKFQLGSADALYDSNTDVSTSINGFYLSMFAEYAF